MQCVLRNIELRLRSARTARNASSLTRLLLEITDNLPPRFRVFDGRRHHLGAGINAGGIGDENIQHEEIPLARRSGHGRGVIEARLTPCQAAVNAAEVGADVARLDL